MLTKTSTRFSKVSNKKSDISGVSNLCSKQPSRVPEPSYTMIQIDCAEVVTFRKTGILNSHLRLRWGSMRIRSLRKSPLSFLFPMKQETTNHVKRCSLLTDGNSTVTRFWFGSARAPIQCFRFLGGTGSQCSTREFRANTTVLNFGRGKNLHLDSFWLLLFSEKNHISFPLRLDVYTRS